MQSVVSVSVEITNSLSTYLYTFPVKYTGAPIIKSSIELIDSSIGE